MLNNDFTRSKHANCAYIKWRNQTAIAFLLLYVYDILIASSDMAEIESLKEDLIGRFEMKDLGDAKRILGMDIMRDRSK